MVFVISTNILLSLFYLFVASIYLSGLSWCRSNVENFWSKSEQNKGVMDYFNLFSVFYTEQK